MQHWVEEARRGNQFAFEQIMGQFQGMAYAVAYAKLQDAHLAEDAVQEAFVEAFRSLHKLKESSAFPGWFKVIVTRACNRMIRNKRPSIMAYEQMIESVDPVPDISDLVVQRDLYRSLYASIAGLSYNLRVAVQLFYFQGYSLKEIEAYLNIPTTVLKKRLFDARRKLKVALPVADFVSVWNDLYEGGKGMLHIVNGDVVADKLRQSGVQGDILVWREIYSEGPIFRDLMDNGNRAIRARYLEQQLGIPSHEYESGCLSQEKALTAFHQYEEVVLWFEHDLFDQTMLSFLLNWFAGQSLGTTKLSLLCIGDYPGIELFRGLGQLSVQQLEGLSGTWQTVGAEVLELGRSVWEAYSSPDPNKLVELLQGNTTALPYVKRAFQSHLSRYPSVKNGLGIIQQMTLELVRDGLSSPMELFKHVGDKLHELGMGDLQYWRCLAGMSQGKHPLLSLDGVNHVPKYQDITTEWRQSKVTLTELGSKVLDGAENWIAINGINEWYGGVHLEGNHVQWRWDSVNKQLVRLSSLKNIVI